MTRLKIDRRSFRVPNFDFKPLIKGTMDRMLQPPEPTQWFSWQHPPVRSGLYDGANVGKVPYKTRLLFIVGEGWFMHAPTDDRYFKIAPPIYWRGQNRP